MLNQSFSPADCIKVYISLPPTNWFVLGISELDVAVLADNNTYGWTVFDCDVVSMTATGGVDVESNIIARPEVGTMTLTVKGASLDPTVETRLHPGLPIQIWMIPELEYYGNDFQDNIQRLWTGRISEIKTDYDVTNEQIVIIEAIDPIYKLLNTNIDELILTDNSTYGTRITELMTQINANLPEDQKITYPTPPTGTSLFNLFDDIDQNSGDWVIKTLEGEAGGLRVVDYSGDRVQWFSRSGINTFMTTPWNTSTNIKMSIANSHLDYTYTNQNFESGTNTGWTITNGGATFASSNDGIGGKKCLSITGTGSALSLRNSGKIPVEADYTRNFNFRYWVWAKAESSPTNFAATVSFWTAADTLITINSSTAVPYGFGIDNGWQEFSYTIPRATWKTAVDGGVAYIKVQIVITNFDSSDTYLLSDTNVIDMFHNCITEIDAGYNTDFFANNVIASLDYDPLTFVNVKNQDSIDLYGENRYEIALDINELANLQLWADDLVLYVPGNTIRTFTVNAKNNPYSVVNLKPYHEVMVDIDLNGATFNDKYLVANYQYEIDRDNFYATYQVWKPA